MILMSGETWDLGTWQASLSELFFYDRHTMMCR